MEIFVGNLPFDITEQEVADAFAQHGTVSKIKMLTDRETGRFRGIAFVTMDDDTQAKAAVDALNEKDLGGRPMRVSQSRGKDERPPRFSGFSGGRKFGQNRRFGTYRKFSEDQRDNETGEERPNRKFGTDRRFAGEHSNRKFENGEYRFGGERKFSFSRSERRFQYGENGGFRRRRFNQDYNKNDEYFGEDSQQ